MDELKKQCIEVLKNNNDTKIICDEKKLLGGDKKLLKWLAENQSEYVSPNRKIKERLKGL